MKTRWMAITVFLAMTGLACPLGAEVLVSAAASLTDVLNALAPEAGKFIGTPVLFNFGGSGALRHQIEEGAPVDLFFSASRQDMDELSRKGLILPETRTDLLSNGMVLIGGPGSSPVETAGAREALRAMLEKTPLLAIGNPDTVPAGRYAVRALTSYGLMAVVKGKLVLGGNVREVLQYVESGSAPLGIVFATDVAVAPPGSVRKLYAFPAEAVGAPIVYPAAVVRASRHREAAEKLIRFFRSPAAREAFRRAGFILP